MNLSSTKNETLLWATGYAVVLGLAIYLTHGLSALHPPYLLYILLAVFGLGLSFLLKAVLKGPEGASCSMKHCVPFLVFVLVQAAVGYALSRYLFNFTVKESLTFPLGAMIALFVRAALKTRGSDALTAWILAGFYAGGLALALRLGGVTGSLAFGLALLNGYFLGGTALGESERHLWNKSLGFAALLIVGRGGLQIFLEGSGYANLGVVITHPYTFVALVAGWSLPWIYQEIEKEKALPTVLSLLLFGVFLPLALGVFIHARPMAAYLMGLIFSGFILGTVYSGSFSLAVLAYLNLATVNGGLSLYQSLAKLSRTTRLEILGGILLLLIVLVLVFSRKNSAPMVREA